MDEQRAWIGSRRRKRLRIMAAILCICLLAAARPDILAAISVRAMGDKTVYVSGFGELPEAVQAQIVPLGTGEGELTLPDTLEAFAAVAEGGNLSEDTDGEDAGQPGNSEGGSENQPGDSEEGNENQPGDSEEGNENQPGDSEEGNENQPGDLEEGNENQPENPGGEDGNQQEEEDVNQPEDGTGEQGAAGSGNSEDGNADDSGG